MNKDFKDALSQSLERVSTSSFVQKLITGDNTKVLYSAYLKYAYQYVTQTTAYTPYCIERIPTKYLKLKQWLLKRASHDLGLELLLEKDLETLDVDTSKLTQFNLPTGVMAWNSSYLYKATKEHPLSLIGMIYFQDGIATELASNVVELIKSELPENETKAITFLQEQGELDHNSLQELDSLLTAADLSEEESRVIIKSIRDAGEIKRFLLDQLVLNELD